MKNYIVIQETGVSGDYSVQDGMQTIAEAVKYAQSNCYGRPFYIAKAVNWEPIELSKETEVKK